MRELYAVDKYLADLMSANVDVTAYFGVQVYAVNAPEGIKPPYLIIDNEYFDNLRGVGYNAIAGEMVYTIRLVNTKGFGHMRNVCNSIDTTLEAAGDIVIGDTMIYRIMRGHIERVNDNFENIEYYATIFSLRVKTSNAS